MMDVGPQGRYFQQWESGVTGLVGKLHKQFVSGRRVRILAEHLSALIPPGSRILDVGCGDGSVGRRIAQLKPSVQVEGIDVLVRGNAGIRVRPFDGTTIPFPDATFDIVMFVDVLHHTVEPSILLREAARVGRTILIKDHIRKGFLSELTLRFMDWVGNAPHGVVLTYNYLSREEWNVAFDQAGLKPAHMTSLELNPPFWQDLHFLVWLERT
jgi:SAM-dependent methyltransferase